MPTAKDPQEILDYLIPFSSLIPTYTTSLGGTTADKAVSITMLSAIDSVTLGAASVSLYGQQITAAGDVVFWASGGIDQTANLITCKVTTTGGRTYVWSGDLMVQAKIDSVS